MTIQEPQTWRFYLPNDHKLGGWAEILICSSGMLAAVSDYGNYAFAWRSVRYKGPTGILRFLFECDADYLIGKLAMGRTREYRPDETLQAVKDAIMRVRHARYLKRDEARREWSLLTECNDLRDQDDIRSWYEHTRLGDAHELPVYGPPSEVVAFVERVIPRLKELIRHEIIASTPITVTILP